MACLLSCPSGQSVESCIVSEWKVKVGDTVAEGDVLFTYETDKSSFEEKQRKAERYSLFLFRRRRCPCLDPVCVIGNPGEDYSSLIPKEGAEPRLSKPKNRLLKKSKSKLPDRCISFTEERIKISPRYASAERTDADSKQYRPVPTVVLLSGILTLCLTRLTLSVAAAAEKYPRNRLLYLRRTCSARNRI